MITDLNWPTAEGMKFFTPDLYLKFQSEDDAVAAAAQEEWEERIVAYAEHLRRLKHERDSAFRHDHDSALGHKRNSPLNRLSDLRLHDYRVLDYTHDLFSRGGDDYFYYLAPQMHRADFPTQPWSWSIPFTVPLKGPNGYVTLAYFVWAHIAVKRPQDGRALPGAGGTFWLYDELDRAWPGTGMYIHRIMLSDGSVLMIPFYHVEVVGDGSPVADPDRKAK